MLQKTISLNGTWEVVFDPRDQGKKKNYPSRCPKGKPVPVPGVWEQVKPGYDGAGWYRTSFTVKKEWKGKNLQLKFGAVNYFAEAWLNGAHLGSHEGGYTPFVFDISSKASVGENILTVRVIDPLTGSVRPVRSM